MDWLVLLVLADFADVGGCGRVRPGCLGRLAAAGSVSLASGAGGVVVFELGGGAS